MANVSGPSAPAIFDFSDPTPSVPPYNRTVGLSAPFAADGSTPDRSFPADPAVLALRAKLARHGMK